MRIVVVLWMFFLPFWSFAQIGDSTVTPYSYRWNNENIFKIHYVDTVNNFTSNYLGEILNVNLDVLKLAQDMVQTNNGDIFRFWIKVENANQINLFFSSIQWNNKDYLHIILPELNKFTGAFSAKFPLRSTTLFPTNIVIVEYFKHHTSSIASVVLKNIGVTNKSSGSCMVNVRCAEGENWEKQKNGVARMLIPVDNSLYTCTGTLINNTLQDKKPYFLTANHCIESLKSSDFEDIIFDFNYEKISCNSNVNEVYQTLVGSSLIATSPSLNGSDFALLLLQDTVPSFYNPYFNGWINMDLENNNGVSIHHPQGDVKKISTYTSNLSSVTINDGITNAFWRVNWTRTANGYGVTEPGSSGSPLFNSDGLVIGALSGGNAQCTNLNGFDAFGKFSFFWDKSGSTNNKRLDKWLDPTNTGVKFLQGLSYDFITVPDTIYTGSSFTVRTILPTNSFGSILNGQQFEIEIENNANDMYNIDLIEVASGKVVYQNSIDVFLFNALVVELETRLSQGVYLLRVYNNKELFRKKIIIQIN
jgi:hypothetical protein